MNNKKILPEDMDDEDFDTVFLPNNESKRKRSSILKQSKIPSIDIYEEEFEARYSKKSIPKRVSFADTFQVKEFLSGNIYDIPGHNSNCSSEILFPSSVSTINQENLEPNTSRGLSNELKSNLNQDSAASEVVLHDEIYTEIQDMSLESVEFNQLPINKTTLSTSYKKSGMKVYNRQSMDMTLIHDENNSDAVKFEKEHSQSKICQVISSVSCITHSVQSTCVHNALPDQICVLETRSVADQFELPTISKKSINNIIFDEAEKENLPFQKLLTNAPKETNYHIKNLKTLPVDAKYGTVSRKISSQTDLENMDITCDNYEIDVLSEINDTNKFDKYVSTKPSKLEITNKTDFMSFVMNETCKPAALKELDESTESQLDSDNFTKSRTSEKHNFSQVDSQSHIPMLCSSNQPAENRSFLNGLASNEIDLVENTQHFTSHGMDLTLAFKKPTEELLHDKIFTETLDNSLESTELNQLPIEGKTLFTSYKKSMDLNMIQDENNSGADNLEKEYSQSKVCNIVSSGLQITHSDQSTSMPDKMCGLETEPLTDQLKFSLISKKLSDNSMFDEAEKENLPYEKLLALASKETNYQLNNLETVPLDVGYERIIKKKISSQTETDLGDMDITCDHSEIDLQSTKNDAIEFDKNVFTKPDKLEVMNKTTFMSFVVEETCQPSAMKELDESCLSQIESDNFLKSKISEKRKNFQVDNKSPSSAAHSSKAPETSYFLKEHVSGGINLGKNTLNFTSHDMDFTLASKKPHEEQLIYHNKRFKRDNFTAEQDLSLAINEKSIQNSILNTLDLDNNSLFDSNLLQTSCQTQKLLHKPTIDKEYAPENNELHFNFENEIVTSNKNELSKLSIGNDCITMKNTEHMELTCHVKEFSKQMELDDLDKNKKYAFQEGLKFIECTDTNNCKGSTLCDEEFLGISRGNKEDNERGETECMKFISNTELRESTCHVKELSKQTGLDDFYKAKGKYDQEKLARILCSDTNDKQDVELCENGHSEITRGGNEKEEGKTECMELTFHDDKVNESELSELSIKNKDVRENTECMELTCHSKNLSEKPELDESKEKSNREKLSFIECNDSNSVKLCEKRLLEVTRNDKEKDEGKTECMELTFYDEKVIENSNESALSELSINKNAIENTKYMELTCHTKNLKKTELDESKNKSHLEMPAFECNNSIGVELWEKRLLGVAKDVKEKDEEGKTECMELTFHDEKIEKSNENNHSKFSTKDKDVIESTEHMELTFHGKELSKQIELDDYKESKEKSGQERFAFIECNDNNDSKSVKLCEKRLLEIIRDNKDKRTELGESTSYVEKEMVKSNVNEHSKLSVKDKDFRKNTEHIELTCHTKELSKQTGLDEYKEKSVRKRLTSIECCDTNDSKDVSVCEKSPLKLIQDNKDEGKTACMELTCHTTLLPQEHQGYGLDQHDKLSTVGKYPIHKSIVAKENRPENEPKNYDRTPPKVGISYLSDTFKFDNKIISTSKEPSKRLCPTTPGVVYSLKKLKLKIGDNNSMPVNVASRVLTPKNLQFSEVETIMKSSVTKSVIINNNANKSSLLTFVKNCTTSSEKDSSSNSCFSFTNTLLELPSSVFLNKSLNKSNIDFKIPEQNVSENDKNKKGIENSFYQEKSNKEYLCMKENSVEKVKTSISSNLELSEKFNGEELKNTSHHKRKNEDNSSVDQSPVKDKKMPLASSLKKLSEKPSGSTSECGVQTEAPRFKEQSSSPFNISICKKAYLPSPRILFAKKTNGSVETENSEVFITDERNNTVQNVKNDTEETIPPDSPLMAISRKVSDVVTEHSLQIESETKSSFEDHVIPVKMQSMATSPLKFSTLEVSTNEVSEEHDENTKTPEYTKTPELEPIRSEHVKILQPTRSEHKTPVHVRPLEHTKTLEHTRFLEQAKTPDNTRTSELVQTFELAKTPEPVQTFELVRTPEPVQTFELVRTPEPVQTFELARTPELVQTFELARTPKLVQTFELVQTPELAKTSENARSLKHYESPEHTKTPEPVSSSENKIGNISHQTTSLKISSPCSVDLSSHSEERSSPNTQKNGSIILHPTESPIISNNEKNVADCMDINPIPENYESLKNDPFSMNELKQSLIQASSGELCKWKLLTLKEDEATFQLEWGPFLYECCLLVHFKSENKCESTVSFKRIDEEKDSITALGCNLFYHFANKKTKSSLVCNKDILLTISEYSSLAHKIEALMQDLYNLKDGRYTYEVSNDLDPLRLAIKIINDRHKAIYLLICDIDVLSYPNKKIVPKIEHQCFNNMIEKVKKAIEKVEPGKNYLLNISRVVNRI